MGRRCCQNPKIEKLETPVTARPTGAKRDRSVLEGQTKTSRKRESGSHTWKHALFVSFQIWVKMPAVAVKFVRSASAARGSPVQIPGANTAPLGKKPCCGRHPTYKVEEDGHRCELRVSLPQQKEEDWQQMLAQGQSSSEKRGGLAEHVSSGLIFLKKKKVRKDKSIQNKIINLHVLIRASIIINS